MKATTLLWRNVRRNPRSFVFASVGIVLGIGTFLYFVALGAGVREHVLDEVFVVDQLEVVPRAVEVGAFQTRGLFGGGGTGLDDDAIADIEALDGVAEVFPRQHLAFPAYASGGESVLGERFWTELIAEGIPPELVADEFGGADRAWNRFVDWEATRTCEGDDACLPGQACVEGACVGRACTPPDEVWGVATEATARGLARTATQQSELTNRQLSVRDAGDGVPAATRWRVTAIAGLEGEARDVLSNLEAPAGTLLSAPTETCDAPSYCQPELRTCAMPVPVLVSPALLELYNGNVQSALSGSTGAARNLPRMTAEGFVGFTFEGYLGRGYLGDATTVQAGTASPRTVRLRLVGFSPRAMTLGATVPLPYVQRWNEHYTGQVREDFDSLLVVTDDSRSLHRVADAITDTLGYQLDERFEQSQRASLMITIVTAVLALLSVLIVSLAALNIMHTFLMAVAERRREIGVLRAVGATRAHIYALLLGEAALIGLVATTIAWGLATAAMVATDRAFAAATPAFPYKPETLFSTPGWLVPGAFGLALVFCLLGALLPAARAARMDPADALRAP